MVNKHIYTKLFANRGVALLILGSLIFGLLSSPAPAHAQADNPDPPGQPVKLVFIHHSTGENWLRDGYGNLGRTLDDNYYFVSDTNYGWGPNGIGDRTDIINWPEWFGHNRNEAALRALFNESGQNSYDVTRTLHDPGGENVIIMFKSCFPNSNLEGNPNDAPRNEGDAMTVANAKHIYIEMLDYFATRPDKMFVVITAPPLSDGTFANNARGFNNWLMTEWLRNYQGSNVFVFDFYNVLTGKNNHHRFVNGAVDYINNAGRNTLQYPSGDDHPSEAGSQKATDEFVALLNVYYHRWAAGAPTSPVIPAEGGEQQQEEEAPPPQEPATGQPQVMMPAGVVDDFESEPGWFAYGQESGSVITCNHDTSMAASGSGSLRMDYNVKADGWAVCEHVYDTQQNWGTSEGISFHMHSSKEGENLIFYIHAGDIDAWTPFDAFLTTTGEDVSGWRTVSIPWGGFNRAHWADASGLQSFDPTLVVSYGINVNGDGTQKEGSIWLDDVTLYSGTPPDQMGQQPQGGEEQPGVQAGEQGEAEGETEAGGRRRLLPCPGSMAMIVMAAVVLLLRRR